MCRIAHSSPKFSLYIIQPVIWYILEWYSIHIAMWLLIIFHGVINILGTMSVRIL